VRIRIRIGLPHPIVCRKRQLNGAPSQSFVEYALTRRISESMKSLESKTSPHVAVAGSKVEVITSSTVILACVFASPQLRDVSNDYKPGSSDCELRTNPNHRKGIRKKPLLDRRDPFVLAGSMNQMVP
jgi:hypothetical protein